MTALAVVVATLVVEGKALAQTAETVSIGTVGLLPEGTGKNVLVAVSNLSVGAGDQGLGVLTFEFVWDKSVVDVVGFTPVLDTQEYNVSANLIASPSTGQFLPPPFGATTGRGIVSIDWASLPPPDAVAGTFTVGNIVVDAAPGVTVGMSTPIKLAVTEFATDSNVDTVQGFATVDGQVNIVDEVTVDIPMSVGFNLIGIPVVIDPPMAASVLAAQLESQGATVDTIRAFSGGFLSWNPSQATLNDFDIKSGSGYFVQLATAPSSGIFQIIGPPIDTPVPLDLGVGFNLVSFPFTSGSETASSLAEAIKSSVDPQAEVSDILDTVRAFSGGFLSWNPSQATLNDFVIKPDAGYFVQLSQSAPGFSVQAPPPQAGGIESQVETSSLQSCRGTRWLVDYLLFNGPLRFLLPLPCVSQALGLDFS